RCLREDGERLVEPVRLGQHEHEHAHAGGEKGNRDGGEAARGSGQRDRYGHDQQQEQQLEAGCRRERHRGDQKREAARRRRLQNKRQRQDGGEKSRKGQVLLHQGVREGELRQEQGQDGGDGGGYGGEEAPAEQV